MTEERERANILIMEKIEKRCDYTISFAGVSPDYFTDEPACWRAVDSAKLDWHFEREGDNFFFVFFDPDNAEVHPASGSTRAEAIATALYEYAKTL